MGRNILSGQGLDERSSEKTIKGDARGIGASQQSVRAAQGLPANMTVKCKTFSYAKLLSPIRTVGQQSNIGHTEPETLSGVVAHLGHTTKHSVRDGQCHGVSKDTTMLMPADGLYGVRVQRFRGVEQSRPTTTTNGSTFAGFQTKHNGVHPVAPHGSSTRIVAGMPAQSSAMLSSPAVFSGHPLVPLPFMSPVATDESRRSDVQTKKIVSSVTFDAPLASPDHRRLNSGMQPRLSVHGFYAESRPLRDGGTGDAACHVEHKSISAFSPGVCNTLGGNITDSQAGAQEKNLLASGSCFPDPCSSKLAATQRSIKSLLGTVATEQGDVSIRSRESMAAAGPNGFRGAHLSSAKLLAVPEGDVLTPFSDSAIVSRSWLGPRTVHGAAAAGGDLFPQLASHCGRSDGSVVPVCAKEVENVVPRFRRSRLGLPPIQTLQQPQATPSTSSPLSSSALQHSWGAGGPGSGSSLLLSVFEEAERASGAAVAQGEADIPTPCAPPVTPETPVGPALLVSTPQAWLSDSVGNRATTGVCRRDVFCKLGGSGAVDDTGSRGAGSTQQWTPVNRMGGRVGLSCRSDAVVASASSSGSGSSLSDSCSLISMSSGGSPSPSSSNGIGLTLSSSAGSGSGSSGRPGLSGGSSSCSRIPLQGEIPRKGKLRGLRSGCRSRPSLASRSTVDDPPHGAAARKQRQREALLRRSLVGFYEESLFFDCLPHGKVSISQCQCSSYLAVLCVASATMHARGSLEVLGLCN